jgi:hypothetical protein
MMLVLLQIRKFARPPCCYFWLSGKYKEWSFSGLQTHEVHSLFSKYLLNGSEFEKGRFEDRQE